MERTIINFTGGNHVRTMVEAFGDSKVLPEEIERVRGVVRDFTMHHADWDHEEIVRIGCRVLENMGYTIQTGCEDYDIGF